MKAVLYYQYGTADVLKVEGVPNPKIKTDEILVEIHYASVNPVDWKIRNGSLRFISGRKFPKRTGVDFSGVVQSVGEGVHKFKPEDQVYGMINPMGPKGACQEFIAVKEKNISKKPSNLNHAEASAVPLAGLTALQGLKNKGNIRPGMNVLIVGCTGGVGSMAVQIAKSFGCTVHGICNSKNTVFAKRLGCDEVINYDLSDPLTDCGTYDLIYDCSAKLSFLKAKKVLNKRGKYITTLPKPFVLFVAPFLNIISSKKCYQLMAKMIPSDLDNLSELIKKGELKPHINKEFPLQDIAKAQQESETEHVVGKVVIKLSQ